MVRVCGRSFVEDNELIIVFEWALGGDLKRIIRRQLEQRTLMDEAVVWGHFSQVGFATDTNLIRGPPD